MSQTKGSKTYKTGMHPGLDLIALRIGGSPYTCSTAISQMQNIYHIVCHLHSERPWRALCTGRHYTKRAAMRAVLALALMLSPPAATQQATRADQPASATPPAPGDEESCATPAAAAVPGPPAAAELLLKALRRDQCAWKKGVTTHALPTTPEFFQGFACQLLVLSQVIPTTA